MQIIDMATPFGRRPAKLALLKQHAARKISVGKIANKWRVFREISAAMALLELPSNSVALLHALLTFYPEDELRHGAQLVVFPSDRQLSLRANGMASATIRRHMAILVETGLIIRRDSPNGKRFARKNAKGEVDTAFGFDLSPLLARAEEFAHLAQQVEEERTKFRHTRQDLTICRRDVRKLISAAIEEQAPGDWSGVERVYLALVNRIPRHPTTSELIEILGEFLLLRKEVFNRLNIRDFSENHSGNAAQIERHIQNSNPEKTIEFEVACEGPPEIGAAPDNQRIERPLKTFSLEMVLRACPQVADYAPCGRISNWQDLMSAAVVVRSMLGVSPSAYQDACEVMGPENAAATIACLLERAGHINSAGGYLRDLTVRSRRGEFSLGPVLMALLRGHKQTMKSA